MKRHIRFFGQMRHPACLLFGLISFLPAITVAHSSTNMRLAWGISTLVLTTVLFINLNKFSTKMSRAGQLRYWPSVPGFVEKPKPLLPLFLFITAYTTTIFLVIFLTYDLNIYPFLELTQKNISRLGAFLFPNVRRFSFDQAHHFGTVELAKVQSIISVFHLLGLGLIIFLLLDALVTSKNRKKFFEQFSPSIRKGIANQSSAFLLGAFGLWFLLIGGFDLASDNKLAAQLCLNESCYVQDDLSLILAAAFQAATLTLSLTLLLSLLAKIFLNIVEVVLT